MPKQNWLLVLQVSNHNSVDWDLDCILDLMELVLYVRAANRFVAQLNNIDDAHDVTLVSRIYYMQSASRRLCYVVGTIILHYIMLLLP